MFYLYASRRRTEKMKRIAENINQNLQPVIRKRPKPPPNPLTPIEIKALEDEAVQVKAEPETVKTELETLREFNRKVARSTRVLYMKLLERGASGATLDQLANDMDFEAASPQVVKAALGLIMKEGMVAETGSNRFAVMSAVKSAGRKTYEITVEKIYPGVAVVTVNDKWRARLTPEEYHGPRQLMKKNSRFRADADLYRMDGKLCITINEVTEKLD
jgi:Fanconi anemia group M protein